MNFTEFIIRKGAFYHAFNVIVFFSPAPYFLSSHFFIMQHTYSKLLHWKKRWKYFNLILAFFSFSPINEVLNTRLPPHHFHILKFKSYTNNFIREDHIWTCIESLLLLYVFERCRLLKTYVAIVCKINWLLTRTTICSDNGKF